MNVYLIYLLIGLVCLAAGYFLGTYIQNLKTESSQSALSEREQQLRHGLSILEGRLSEAEEQKTSLQQAR